ncbi:MAG: hypothetical protein ACAI34_20955, partial [Verrucomicrobium sp.]
MAFERLPNIPYRKHVQTVVLVVLWLLAWSPALLVLSWIAENRIRIPYHDSWAYIAQYQAWTEGDYGLKDLFQPHNGHPSVVGKLLYFAVLHGLGGDVSVLPFLPWAFSAVIAVSVLLLARPLLVGKPCLGPGLMLLANLSIFTGAQGHTWVWDFVFQNFIPGACLAAALALLRPSVVWSAWRGITAFALSVAAAFSFGSGFLVGPLLFPVLAFALPRPWSQRRKMTVLGMWGVGMVIVIWLALFATHSATSMGPKEALLEDVTTRPLMAVSYILVLLGHTLGQGAVLEAVVLCMWAGGLLALVLLGAGALLAWRCRVSEGWRAAMPWIICCAWAVGNAGIICLVRMEALLETALAPRYATFMMFMVLGIVFLVATFWRHASLRSLLPLSVSRLPIPAAGVALLLAGHLSGWTAGFHSFQVYRSRMISEVAATDFVRVLPINREVQWDTDHGEVKGWLNFLSDQNRLKGVKFLPDTRLANLRQGAPLLEKFASFEL